MTKAKQAEATQALEYLRESVKENDVVYCVLRSVAPSGMSRVLDLFVIREGRVHRIGYNVAAACGYSYNREKLGVKVNGCGMDMGGAVVFNLSYALFGDEYKLTSQWV